MSTNKKQIYQNCVGHHCNWIEYGGAGCLKLTDYEPSLPTGPVVPLAIHKDFHTVLPPIFIIGFPLLPVGVCDGIAIQMLKFALCLDVIYPKKYWLFMENNYLLNCSILSSVPGGSELAASLQTPLPQIVKVAFIATGHKGFVAHNLATWECRDWNKQKGDISPY